MATEYSHPAVRDSGTYERPLAEAFGSGVSWGAIFAGAVGAASLSLVLMLLGTGLGFSSISPWSDRGADAATIGIATVLWLSFTQIAASGMGGYLAGRLRTKWAGLHGDEVYFRDTAHGFLAWSVATLLTASVLASAVGAIVGSGVQAGAAVAGGAASTASVAGARVADSAASSDQARSDAQDVMGYFVDSLFRRDMSAPDSTTPGAATAPATDGSQAAVLPPPAARPNVDATTSGAEVGRIFVNSLNTGTLPPDDTKYVGQIVAERTGLSQADAEKRVTDTFNRAKAAIEQAKTKAKETADAARKATAYASMWLVVSLLLGAFVASLAATYGGRRRDL